MILVTIAIKVSPNTAGMTFAITATGIVRPPSYEIGAIKSRRPIREGMKNIQKLPLGASVALVVLCIVVSCYY
ncbi:hypothetical protein VEx25_1373 [Vibrio antiquarius]|uniref:Uncharacterized protein n=1 Tax=Vibrio antiquarius (strain Ex25) TaxID=150340 RepID=A0ABM9WVP2_VIBAE|nr:hypothetical protein VEx25_1373 [Vibrio antiquarius]